MKPVERKLAVRISNRTHPHYGEWGHPTGKIVRLIHGKEMAEIKLANGDLCCVGKGDVTEI